MELVVIYLIMGLLAAYALYLTFRRRSQALVDPVLGFLNLEGERFASLIAEDQAALSPLFSKIERRTGYETPKCNVLFVYAEIASDGSFGLGAESTLRHLAEKAGASVAVLATNNAPEASIASANLPGPKRANVVWTLNRRGDSFPRFFKELFTKMKAGKGMPIAWNSIAPQYKSANHDELPETICALEAGQVRFR